jgi:glycosyltransferase involved in cell wall biosynthesis
MYARQIAGVPVVVTCHDLLAVRGALGEQTDCPASATGKILQRWIVAGLRSATAVACVSRATAADAVRLVRGSNRTPKIETITLGLSYPFVPIANGGSVLAALDPRLKFGEYVLHVGSNLRRKNRQGVLRIFSKTATSWNGLLVLAGEGFSDELRSLVRELQIEHRVVEVSRPSNEQLAALYSCATALLYPSRFEGFGWPIAEAQACGCPVVCTDAEPMSEVGGDAALKHPLEYEEAFAADILRLADPAERARWSAKSLQNAKRFSTTEMISKYRELYRSIGASC